MKDHYLKDGCWYPKAPETKYDIDERSKETIEACEKRFFELFVEDGESKTYEGQLLVEKYSNVEGVDMDSLRKREWEALQNGDYGKIAIVTIDDEGTVHRFQTKETNREETLQRYYGTSSSRVD